MLTRKPVEPVMIEPMPHRFCRGCGYDLRASVGRCPDCGRAFDAQNPRTFMRRRPTATETWLRRAGVALLAVVLLTAGALAWLRHGWVDEQQRLVELQRHIDPASSVLPGTRSEPLSPWLPLSPGGYRAAMVVGTRTEPLSPWLRTRLPDRFGIYLDRVEGLWCIWGGATDDDMRLISGLTRLRRFMVESSNVTDAGVAQLRGLTEMQALTLHCDHLTDAGVANLEGMQRMQELCIEGGEMTNAGLKYLHGMPNLRSLMICMNHVNRDGLRHWLKQHPGVVVVTGPGTPLTQEKEAWEQAGPPAEVPVRPGD